MRTVEEIKASIATTKAMIPLSPNDEYNLGDYRENILKSLDEELRLALTASIPLDRLETICTAEKDGRCVVLPCKVGDKVKVDVRAWGNVYNLTTVDYGKFLVGEVIAIVKTRKQTLMKIQVESNVTWKHERKRYPISAFGVTVFPRAEAEKALGKEQGHD